MTDPSRNLSELWVDEYCAISSNPVDFQPQQIIYRELIVTLPDTENSYYRNIYVPREYNVQTFPRVIRQIALHGYSSLSRDPPEQALMDIPVYKRSVIVVQLPRNTSQTWGVPAILLKRDGNGDCPDPRFYGGLRYVDGNGNATTTPVGDCKLIYFFARFKSNHVQTFSYRVDGIGRPTKLADIDPDVRHPGVGGQNYEQE